MKITHDLLFFFFFFEKPKCPNSKSIVKSIIILFFEKLNLKKMQTQKKKKMFKSWVKFLLVVTIKQKQKQQKHEFTTNSSIVLCGWRECNPNETFKAPIEFKSPIVIPAQSHSGFHEQYNAERQKNFTQSRRQAPLLLLQVNKLMTLARFARWGWCGGLQSRHR